METTGPFRKEIRLALLEAYPTPSDLRMLVEETLGEPLQNISLANDMPTIAFDLIGWARARGRLSELIAGAAAERPRSSRLKTLSSRFEFTARVAGEEERVVRDDVPFENALQWAEKMYRSRSSVCRIEPQPLKESNEGYGTGFLVAKDVVLTNYHVVDSQFFHADRVVLRFDCDFGSDGKETPGRTCGLAADWKVATSPRVADGGCDYALLRLAEKVADDALPAGPRGALGMGPHDFRWGQPLFILQHPMARPLSLSIGTVTNAAHSPVQIAYDANTDGGSSGSPCFNSALRVVALHHWGETKQNVGVKAESILKDLATKRIPGLDALGLQS